ncbi:MAG TPA: hypothetical protein VK932_07695, partial [Kofleriaceae bacterium]|nr:hypothetical protein [Kofleriaceae bacterium]
MRRLGIACFLLVGCSFSSPEVSTDAPTGPVDGTDGMPDAPADTRGCHGTLALTRVCLAAEPASPLTLSGTIDTATAACAPTTMGTAAGACVLAGTTVTIAGIVAVGPRPLVVVATGGEIDVTGAIDVASHAGGELGAGARAGTCNTGTAATNRGGGAGGSFGFRGGNGGEGSQDPAGGTAGAPITLGGTL